MQPALEAEIHGMIAKLRREMHRLGLTSSVVVCSRWCWTFHKEEEAG
jgi:hypothetical protein